MLLNADIGNCLVEGARKGSLPFENGKARVLLVEVADERLLAGGEAEWLLRLREGADAVSHVGVKARVLLIGGSVGNNLRMPWGEIEQLLIGGTGDK